LELWHLACLALKRPADCLGCDLQTATCTGEQSGYAPLSLYLVFCCGSTLGWGEAILG
jgi:hypothetical protein